MVSGTLKNSRNTGERLVNLPYPDVASNRRGESNMIDPQNA
jgi:hypothetical protein